MINLLDFLVNMEDYTFMYLKKTDDCIVRIISDFLPHESEIDFFPYHPKNS